MFDDLDLNPMGVIFGIVGGVFGFWMASRMISNYLWIVLSALASAGAGYIISSKVSDS